MSSSTTNLGLTKLAGSENFSNSTMNTNWDKVDTFAGETNSKIAYDWTSCADYKATAEASANCVLQSFGKMRMLTFQGVARTHTEDELLMTLPAAHRPLGSNNIYAAGSIGSTPVTIRLNGSDGRVILFIANSVTANARLYFQMVWVAA